MPSRQARSSARGRPPFGLRFCFGKTGAIRAHCASLMNCSIAAAEPLTAEIAANHRLGSETASRAAAPTLPGFRLRIVDGNHLAATEKRAAPLRG